MNSVLKTLNMPIIDSVPAICSTVLCYIFSVLHLGTLQSIYYLEFKNLYIIFTLSTIAIVMNILLNNIENIKYANYR